MPDFGNYKYLYNWKNNNNNKNYARSPSLDELFTCKIFMRF